MSYLIQAFSLLLQLAFSAVATLFMLRILAEASRADFHNPLSQFIYRYTNPVLARLRRLIPNWRRINSAAVLLVWLLMLLKRAILFLLLGVAPGLIGLLVLSLADLLDFIAVFYMVLIIGWSLMSLFSVDSYHPVQRLVGALVAPVMRPLRGRLVAGGLDFGPWVVLIVLMLARVLIVGPLEDLGTRLAIGA